jgi:hypothetical protein
MLGPDVSVNWDDLKSNCGEDEELARELIHIFLSESPQMLEDIRKSCRAKDAVALNPGSKGILVYRGAKFIAFIKAPAATLPGRPVSS